MSQSTVRSAQLSVGTATPALVAWGNSGGSRVYVHQAGNSNHAIYFGGSAVTAATGFLIHKGEHLDIYLPEGAGLYAIANTAETIYVMQTGGI